LTASMIGQAFDKQTQISQQINLASLRSLQFQPDEVLSGVLSKSSRASKLLGFAADGSIQFYSAGGVTPVPVGANPTALVGLSVANGVSANFLRADGAPALDQTISPTMTGTWIFGASAGASGVQTTFNGKTNLAGIVINGSLTTGQSFGQLISAGTNSSDYAFSVVANSSQSFKVDGTGLTIASKGIRGVTGTTDAATGNIGEPGTATRSSPLSLSNNAATDVTSVTLTAGDWYVWGNIYYAYGSTTTSSDLDSWINTTSASYPGGTAHVTYYTLPVAAAAGNGLSQLTPVVHIKSATGVTAYLSCAATFATSALSVTGTITACRSPNAQ